MCVQQTLRPPLAAVLFDLDDTLHDDTATYQRAAERVANDVARRHRCDPSALYGAYVAQAQRFWHELSPEQLRSPLVDVRARLWAAALAGVGLHDAALATICADRYNGYRRESLTLWPGALNLLMRLHARGLKLGLITNGFAETHREKIALLALEEAFDEIFIADEVGLLKPDPRLFRLAAKRLGVRPETCAMVGDRLGRDIRGAHAVGMFTVWVNVRGEQLPVDGVRPDAIVSDIVAVEDVLPRAALAFDSPDGIV